MTLPQALLGLLLLAILVVGGTKVAASLARTQAPAHADHLTDLAQTAAVEAAAVLDSGGTIAASGTTTDPRLGTITITLTSTNTDVTATATTSDGLSRMATVDL